MQEAKRILRKGLLEAWDLICEELRVLSYKRWPGNLPLKQPKLVSLLNGTADKIAKGHNLRCNVFILNLVIAKVSS